VELLDSLGCVPYIPRGIPRIIDIVAAELVEQQPVEESTQLVEGLEETTQPAIVRGRKRGRIAVSKDIVPRRSQRRRRG
jgi:hypothetical protein